MTRVIGKFRRYEMRGVLGKNVLRFWEIGSRPGLAPSKRKSRKVERGADLVRRATLSSDSAVSGSVIFFL